MCMSYDQAVTDALRQSMAAETTPPRIWKVYSVTGSGSGKALMSPIRGTPVEIAPDGMIVSDRESAALTDGEELDGVKNGIHVPVGGEADDAIHNIDNDGVFVAIPVSARPEDLVGCDPSGRHAVFMQITVDPAQVKALMENPVVVEDEEDDFPDEDEDDFDEDEDEDEDDDWDDDDDDDDFDDDEDGDWDDEDD